MNQIPTHPRNSVVRDWRQAAERLSSALILDVLDTKGLRQQALRPGIVPRTGPAVVVGVAKTLLWMDFAHDDPDTYELELKAVDSVQPDDLIVCATGNSHRSGIWGELLTTAAVRKGAVGVVTDGGVRDVAKIEALGFPVFSRFLSPYDSFNRQKVLAYDIRVEIDDITIEPGDIVVADRDGVAVVPGRLSSEILVLALGKAGKEDQFRDAVKAGMSLSAAYEKYHIL